MEKSWVWKNRRTLLHGSALHNSIFNMQREASRLPHSIFAQIAPTFQYLLQEQGLPEKARNLFSFLFDGFKVREALTGHVSETFHIFQKFIDFCGPLQTNHFEYPICTVGRDFRGCSKCEFCNFLGFQIFLKTPTSFGHRSYPIGNLKKGGLQVLKTLFSRI